VNRNHSSKRSSAQSAATFADPSAQAIVIVKSRSTRTNVLVSTVIFFGKGWMLGANANSAAPRAAAQFAANTNIKNLMSILSFPPPDFPTYGIFWFRLS
jgi:hypothetical protein